MKRLAIALMLSMSALAACDGATDFNIPKAKDLKPGGVYVAYNLGCDQGCDQIQKGDLIQKIDGKDVRTSADFDAATLTDGQPHELDLLAAKTFEAKKVTIVAKPNDKFPPIQGAPPVWAVGAEQLDKAPDWARRRMFAHASPMVQLVSVDGGITDGRQLRGKKRLIVYWDQGDRTEQGAAVVFMKVLQRAQADLNAKGVEIMFTQVKFPNGRLEPLNDTDLRKWAEKWTEVGADGKTPLPPLPMYRFPNATEFNQAREIGMEGSFTVFENLGQSPTIVLLDERGIVRWHSEGVANKPDSTLAPGTPEHTGESQNYTTIEAIKFALEHL
jgi:hypothetical protein